jgi:cell division transport system permease protein
MLITWIFFFQGISNFLRAEVQNKIDITAYFKEDVLEDDILKVKEEILKLSPDIKNVQYVSREHALAIFNQRHKESSVLARALEEIGTNPFLPSLNITTSGDPLQYEEIAIVLETSDFSKLIEKVDFLQKKETIEKVYSITSTINSFSIILGIILVFIAVLVVFSTIKLAIDNSKDEISTMKIVGATDWFIRAPFVIQGALYGIIAFLICILLSLLSAYFLSPKLATILPGFSLFDYFLTNFWILVLIQLAFGIVVGVISSIVVVRKYLEV